MKFNPESRLTSPYKDANKMSVFRHVPVDAKTWTRDPIQTTLITAKTHILDLPSVDHCSLLFP